MYIKRNKTTVFPFTTYIYCTSSHLLISLKLTGNGKGRKRKKETEGMAKTSHHCGLMNGGGF